MGYRDNVLKTFNGGASKADDILMAITGLIGETGEIVDWSKKNLFHKKKPSTELLMYEIGDVRWYVEALQYLVDYDGGLKAPMPLINIPDDRKIMKLALEASEDARLFNWYAQMYLIGNDSNLIMGARSIIAKTDHINRAMADIGVLIGYPMDYIEKANSDKLRERYPEKFEVQ